MGNWFSKLFFGDAKPDPVSKNADIRNSEGQNSGKSSLFKAIINVKRFNLIESCDSISTPRKYCHSIEKQLLIFELPGIGSEN